MLAQLLCDHDGVWHEITKYPPETVEVTVPAVSNPRRRYGIRTRRRDLDPADCATRQGLRVTALPLTVVEAAARRGGGMKIIDTALQQHLLDLRDLWGAHLRNKGRHGSPAARSLLRTADSGAHSEAERLLVGLLRQAGITGWQANQRLGRWEIDVGGLAFHRAVCSSRERSSPTPKPSNGIGSSRTNPR